MLYLPTCIVYDEEVIFIEKVLALGYGLSQ